MSLCDYTLIISSLCVTSRIPCGIGERSFELNLCFTALVYRLKLREPAYRALRWSGMLTQAKTKNLYELVFGTVYVRVRVEAATRSVVPTHRSTPKDTQRSSKKGRE